MSKNLPSSISRRALLVGGIVAALMPSRAFARCGPGARCIGVGSFGKADKDIATAVLEDQNGGSYATVTWQNGAEFAISLRRTAPVGPNGNIHEGKVILPGPINNMPLLTDAEVDLTMDTRTAHRASQKIAVAGFPGDRLYFKFAAEGDMAVVPVMNGRNILTGERFDAATFRLESSAGTPRNYLVAGSNGTSWLDRGVGPDRQTGQLTLGGFKAGDLNAGTVEMIIVPRRKGSNDGASGGTTRSFGFKAGDQMTQGNGDDTHTAAGSDPNGTWDLKSAAHLKIGVVDARQMPGLEVGGKPYGPVTPDAIKSLVWFGEDGAPVGKRYSFDPAYRQYVDRAFGARGPKTAP